MTDDARKEAEREERRAVRVCAVRRRRKARLKAAKVERSRGGLTSKIRLAVERRCRPLSIILTPGQAADSPQFVPVLKKIRVRGPVGRTRTRPDANMAHLRKRNIKGVIPEKADQAANRKKKGRKGGRPVSHDAELYKDRNTVERGINRFKEWQGLAARYDKTPESYEAGLRLRGAIIWIRSLPTIPWASTAASSACTWSSAWGTHLAERDQRSLNGLWRISGVRAQGRPPGG